MDSNIQICYHAGAKLVQLKPLYQYDHGVKLHLSGVDKNSSVLMHYSIGGMIKALEDIPLYNEEQCIFESELPNILLTQTQEIQIYVFITSGQSGQTKMHLVQPIIPRPKPENYTYTNEELRGLEYALNQLKIAVDKIPNALPNPHALTINGHQYDGSKPVKINISGSEEIPNAGVSREELEALIDEYFENNPVQTTEIDATLKKTGAAADAAAVGNAINAYREEINKKANDNDLASVAKTGDYNDLNNLPNIPNVPNWAMQETKPSYKAEDVSADPAGTASSLLSSHNTNNEAHNDLRLALKELAERLDAFFDADDQTLDELSELIEYIKNNKTLIDGITANKVNVNDIVDNLTTNVSNRPLSAAQGVALKALIDAIKVPTALSELSEDSTHRVVTDAEKTTWNAKSNFSGTYSDLTDKPSIPSALSDLTQDSTHRTVTDAEKEAWNTRSDFSGDYNDLTGKPTIPSSLSDLTQDAEHRTVSDAEKESWNTRSDFSGDYNDLKNKPTIPTVPTAVSAFQNDAGYLTEHQDISGKLDANKLPEAINSALAQAKESGEFDGEKGDQGDPGFSPTIQTSKSGKVTTITLTDKDGEKTVTINDGADGSPGDPGNGIASAILNADYTLTLNFEDGTKYTTPSIRGATGGKGDTGPHGVSITKVEQTTTSSADGGTNVITVTLSNGQTFAFNVKNGSKGSTGATGVGITSVAQTTTSSADGGSNIITVTKTDGTTSTFTVKNGSKGSTGSNGTSCTHSWSGTTLSVTSASGTSSVNLKGDKGDKGDKPIKGTDYWTDADRQQMVNDVLAALPVAEEASFG